MNFCLTENYYDFKRMFENFEFQDEKTLDPFEQKFKVAKKNCKAKYTTKDIVYYNNKVVSMKNSVLFYLNHFYKKMDYYKFNISIPKTLHSVITKLINSLNLRIISVICVKRSSIKSYSGQLPKFIGVVISCIMSVAIV